MFIGLGSNICDILDILDILDKVDLHHLADCKHVCSQTWQVSFSDWNHLLDTLSSVSQFKRIPVITEPKTLLSIKDAIWRNIFLEPLSSVIGPNGLLDV